MPQPRRKTKVLNSTAAVATAGEKEIKFTLIGYRGSNAVVTWISVVCASLAYMGWEAVYAHLINWTAKTMSAVTRGTCIPRGVYSFFKDTPNAFIGEEEQELSVKVLTNIANTVVYVSVGIEYDG